MLVTQSGSIKNEDSCEMYSFNGTIFYVNGFIFTRGRKSGSDTVEWLAARINETGEIPFELLYGAFSVFIVYSNGKVNMFTDNSNQHVLYVHEKAVSDNFL